MKRDLKAKWLAALRSGQYDQGTGMLRTLDNKFCCLGVLLEIAGFPCVEDGGSCYRYLNGDGATSATSLPKGFPGKDELPWVNLMKMNDDSRETFPQIADWIETNIPEEEE